MIIDLAGVGRNERPIDINLDADEIQLTGEPFVLDGPLSLRGELRRTSVGVEFRGGIVAEALIDCTRCLQPVPRHFDIPFRTIFVENEPSDAAATVELSEDQLDETWAEDGNADLAALAREQLLLAIPEQVLCRDDCKGLCPKCGENLNLIDCNCADKEIDPRWAALKEIVNGKP